MSLLRGDENGIRGTLAHVLHARRDFMMESLDRLVRQCDAKIPRVAPSLFDAPLTERRWLAFLRAEEVRARWLRGSALMRTAGLAAAWMLVLAGCSSCTPRPSPDASPPDASDAASSAEGGPQTCSQAPGDPSFRCDLVASSPGWKRIGCLPACGIEIADDPARSDAPALSWQPCADGRAGCTELRIDERDAAERNWSFVSSWTADRHLLWIVRTAHSNGESQTHLLDARSGAALFAAHQRMGVPAECTQLPLAVQRSRALIGFTSWLSQAPYSGRVAIDLTEPSATLQPPRIFDFASCGANFRASECVSTSRGMVCITSARQVIRWDDAQSKPEWLGTYDSLRGVPGELRVVQDDVWFSTSSWDADLAIHVMPRGASIRRFAPEAGGDAFAFASDGTEMAWLEGASRDRSHSPQSGDVFRSVSLFVAPYVNSASALRRRRLGPLPDLRTTTGGMIGSGFYAYFASTTDLVPPAVTVVRLNDGAYWHLRPSDGYAWGPDSPVWMGGGEIALSRDILLRPGVPEIRSLQRIRLDALGPPEGTLSAL